MKIARIDTHSVKVPYTFGGSHKGEGLRTWTTNNILLVRVETDSGIVGWGEAFCYACTDAVRASPSTPSPFHCHGHQPDQPSPTRQVKRRLSAP